MTDKIIDINESKIKAFVERVRPPKEIRKEVDSYHLQKSIL